MNRILSFLFHDVYHRDRGESGFDGAVADGYKLPVEAFDRHLTALAGVFADATLTAGLVPAPHSGAGARIALTFDDGGVSYHDLVADRLELRGWRGHCFVTTGCIGRRGFLRAWQVRDLHARGHVIGSHSVSHPRDMTACGWGELVREWSDSRKTLEDIIGAPVAVASVPSGAFAPDVARAAREADLKTLFTSEPELETRYLGGCHVLGRYTVRAGHTAGFVARVARLHAPTLAQEWLVWNGKKALKSCLGPAYARFSVRWQQHRDRGGAARGQEARP